MKIIVTGGTSGIGLSITEAFAKEGHQVLACGLEENGQKICQEINQKNINTSVFFSKRDLSLPQDCGALIEDALQLLGGLDVLVNNAGIQHVAPIEEFSPSQWEKIIAVNLSSAFYLSQKAFPIFKKQNFGRIIMVASAHGLRASEYKAAYVAAKHGVLGLNKVLALEGAPFGITSNAICPGYVRTPLVDKQIQEQALAHGIPEERVISEILLKKQPIKKFIKTSAIASMALHLCSEAGESITGSAITMDGGWTAQ